MDIKLSLYLESYFFYRFTCQSTQKCIKLRAAGTMPEQMTQKEV